MSKICRKVVKMLLLKKAEGAVRIDGSNIDSFLGVRKTDFGLAAKENQVTTTVRCGRSAAIC